MIAEIVAVGSEMLTPHRQDTNSLYLTGQLNDIGVSVAFKTIVGDNLRQLTSVARTAIERSDLIIFMGDWARRKTTSRRECVADALGVELQRNHDLVAAMYKRFAERRISMPENNARQADVITGRRGDSQHTRQRSRAVAATRARWTAADHPTAARASA